LFGIEQLLAYTLLEIILTVLLLGPRSISCCCHHYSLCFPSDGMFLLGGWTFNNSGNVVSTEVYRATREMGFVEKRNIFY